MKLQLSPDETQSGVLSDEKLAGAIETYRQHGVLWVEDFVSREFVQQLSEVYAKKYASLDQSELEARFAAVGDRRFMITLDIKGKFNSPALYANPIMMLILGQLLGQHFIVSSFGSVLAFPGAANQPTHFDYPPLYSDEAICAALPPHAITLVVPLVDINESTGSTAVWPGTHAEVGARQKLENLVESGSLDGSVTPQPKMGDAFLMDFRLIHAGTANTSETPRPILYIVYSRPWFREDMNFAEQPAINLTRKQYKKMPKELRYLFAAATVG